VEVEAEVGRPTENNHPREFQVAWRFPKRGDMAPVTMRWFQGRPWKPKPEAEAAGIDINRAQTVYYGTKGIAMNGSHMGGVRLVPEAFAKQVGKPKEVLPRVSGGHTGDFLNAVRTRGKSSADFDYSARLTEIMLLGNVAARVGEKVTYDFRTGKFVNNPKADALIRRDPRKGWEFGYV
jgi:hypothetical protein